MSSLTNTLIKFGIYKKQARFDGIQKDAYFGIAWIKEKKDMIEREKQQYDNNGIDKFTNA